MPTRAREGGAPTPAPWAVAQKATGAPASSRIPLRDTVIEQ